MPIKLEPGAQVGPYKILGELGRGGMATVYRAYQPNLEREVALKVLPEVLVEEPGFKTRFHREAVAVARLQHPNILSVFDHGEQDGVTYIVSEYIEGGTLAARLGAPIQIDYVVRLLRPIADALDYAHSEGIVHRDVKPSNILLDLRGTPILSDFGLARMADAVDQQRLTQTGTMVGTPTYMAPEQCAGMEAGPAADIYALAVIAYEMLCGRVPFTGLPLSVIAAHQVKQPPMPRKINPSLPVAVEQALLTGLAKDPSHRPETGLDFIDLIASGVTTPLPLNTPPPPPPDAGPILTPPPGRSATPPSAPWSPPAAPPPATPPPSYPNAPPGYGTPPPPTPPPHTLSPPTFSPPPPPAPPVAMSPTPYIPPQYSAPAAPAAPAYTPPAQWAAPAARKPGLPMWVLVVLAVGAALAALALVFAISVNLFATAMTATDRWSYLGLTLLFALATAAPIAALIGLAGRDRWAPTAAWAAIGTLALTVCGIPLAAAAAWGLYRTPTNEIVTRERKPGGGMRVGSAAGLVALLLIIGTSTVAWGWTHPATTASNNTPLVTVSPSPTACVIAEPGGAVDATAANALCGFGLSAPVVDVNCRTASALPPELASFSRDNNKSEVGGGGTFSMDSSGCHFTSPSYFISSRMESVNDLPVGDTVMVADVIPATSGNYDFDFLYGCDTTGCIEAAVFTSDSTLQVFDDGKSLVSEHVTIKAGKTNRLMMTVQQKQIRVWFNGTIITTQSAARLHDTGLYIFELTSFDKTGSVHMDAVRFAVYRLL
jgi:serine/threonine protein kinase